MISSLTPSSQEFKNHNQSSSEIPSTTHPPAPTQNITDDSMSHCTSGSITPRASTPSAKEYIAKSRDGQTDKGTYSYHKSSVKSTGIGSNNCDASRSPRKDLGASGTGTGTGSVSDATKELLGQAAQRLREFMDKGSTDPPSEYETSPGDVSYDPVSPGSTGVQRISRRAPSNSSPPRYPDGWESYVGSWIQSPGGKTMIPYIPSPEWLAGWRQYYFATLLRGGKRRWRG